MAALFEEGADAHHPFNVRLISSGDATSLRWHTEEKGSVSEYDFEPAAACWLRLWRGWLGMLLPERML